MRLKSNYYTQELVGLTGLKEVVRAFQHEIDNSSVKIRIEIAQTFFPQLETMMVDIMSNLTGTDEQLKKLILIAKIFLMINTLKIPRFLMEQGKIDNWVNFVVFILEHELD